MPRCSAYPLSTGVVDAPVSRMNVTGGPSLIETGNSTMLAGISTGMRVDAAEAAHARM
jgi:hypothetical protein